MEKIGYSCGKSNRPGRTVKSIQINTKFLSNVDGGHFLFEAARAFPLNFLQGYMNMEGKVEKFHLLSSCVCL